jgi:hypothetical protein
LPILLYVEVSVFIIERLSMLRKSQNEVGLPRLQAAVRVESRTIRVEKRLERIIAMEGTLFAIGQIYTINGPDGPQLTEGKPLEIQLGGHWIAGHVERVSRQVAQPAGVGGDSVMEASEESFPASDAPSWSPGTISRDAPSTYGPAYRFVAAADNTLCGLHPGMRVRIQQA